MQYCVDEDDISQLFDNLSLVEQKKIFANLKKMKALLAKQRSKVNPTSKKLKAKQTVPETRLPQSSVRILENPLSMPSYTETGTLPITFMNCCSISTVSELKREEPIIMVLSMILNSRILKIAEKNQSTRKLIFDKCIDAIAKYWGDKNVE